MLWPLFCGHLSLDVHLNSSIQSQSIYYYWSVWENEQFLEKRTMLSSRKHNDNASQTRLDGKECRMSKYVVVIIATNHLIEAINVQNDVRI